MNFKSRPWQVAIHTASLGCATMMLFSLGVPKKAAEAPLKVLNGSSVRMAVAGHRELATAIKPTAAGGAWRVSLAPTSGGTAELTDVTGGANMMKFVLAVQKGELTLDSERFIAGH